MELKSEHNEQTKRVKAPYYYLLLLEILRSPRALGDLINASNKTLKSLCRKKLGTFIGRG